MSEKPEPKFVTGDLVEVIMVYRPNNQHVVGKRFYIKAMKWVLCARTKKWRWGYYLANAPVPEFDERNGFRTSFAEEQLRHPPKDEPTTFENCVWQPKKETA